MEEKEIEEKLTLLLNFLVLVKNALDHNTISTGEALDSTRRMIKVLQLGRHDGI